MELFQKHVVQGFRLFISEDCFFFFWENTNNLSICQWILLAIELKLKFNDTRGWVRHVLKEKKNFQIIIQTRKAERKKKKKWLARIRATARKPRLIEKNVFFLFHMKIFRLIKNKKSSKNIQQRYLLKKRTTKQVSNAEETNLLWDFKIGIRELKFVTYAVWS